MGLIEQNTLWRSRYPEQFRRESIGRVFAAKGEKIGGAVGHNPISIIIPCHRVVGSDGSLTGYAGGVDKKRSLLTIERAKGF